MLALVAGLGSTALAQTAPNLYTQRFIDLRAKIVNPANGYFSPDGVPYHSVETLMAEAPDYGHETTSEAYSYWIWLEVMNGRVTGDWTPLNNAWTKMEAKAIPTADLQPTTSGYNANAPATYAPEFGLPDSYPAALNSGVLAGQDPVSPDLTASYGTNIYGMHWIFDCDNFYGYGSKGEGVSTPSYRNTFQRGEQESTFETVPHPSWEAFKWGSNDGTGFLRLFVSETSAPAAQWRYTNAPDADARAVQAIYWGVQFAKEQGLTPANVLPLAKASKMGDFGRLAMFDKYFRSIGVQSTAGPGGTGYTSAHYLMSWYYAWGGPLTPQGWAWRIGSSHAHFGYQNPVAALALSTVPELRVVSANGPRDWGQSLTRQLEFYQWLQSAEGAIAGGATNSFNGRYEAYPVGTPTFYNMAYQENPVYHDPGSNTWFGFQAWSMERVAEYYYITNDVRAKAVMDKWVAWVKSAVQLTADGSFAVPSTLSWAGAPVTWNPASPAVNTGLHVTIVNSGTDLGVTAGLAKALTYYAAATQRYATLDTAARDLAQQLLDRMWTKFFEPTGKGVAVVEGRADYHRIFDQTVFIPAGWSGKMANGDPIVPGIKFIDIRTKYRNDPDFPALLAAFTNGTDFQKTYHRFWAQADIALANAEFGRFFGTPVVPVPVTGVTVAPVSASVGVGGTVALTATVAPTTATNKAVTWTSSAPAVATVSATGVVTGVTAGSAIVTVRTTDGGFTATSSILVTNATVPVTGVTVAPTSITIAAGTTTTLTATVAPATATNKAVTWTSSNTAAATVSATGVVTGVAAGTSTITVRTTDGGFTVTSLVTVTANNVAVTGVTVAPTSATIAVGGTTTLTATVAPANATNKAVTWTSSNTAVATVSATGVVTGVSAGMSTITVRTTDGGFTAISVVTVTTNTVAVTGVTVAPTTASVAVGSTTALTATVAPANATNKAVTWTSSNTAVATVSATGVVTGVSAGTATITVRTTDGGFTATSVVTVTAVGGTPCANPVAITLSFAKDGVGEFCFVTSGNVNFTNNWNMQLVEINGVNFTSRWSNAMPPRINGNYYIHYIGNFPWSHFEMNGTN